MTVRTKSSYITLGTYRHEQCQHILIHPTIDAISSISNLILIMATPNAETAFKASNPTYCFLYFEFQDLLRHRSQFSRYGIIFRSLEFPDPRCFPAASHIAYNISPLTSIPGTIVTQIRALKKVPKHSVQACVGKACFFSCKHNIICTGPSLTTLTSNFSIRGCN
jgi:hypothetical protein